MIKLHIHSIVDVITNSSTVIFTYQNSIEQTKELVSEILRLMGSPLKPDDVFYYGVFCDNSYYDTLLSDEQFRELQLNIMKGIEEKPDWMISAEEGDDDYGLTPGTYLALVPKDLKFEKLGKKISKLLNSVDADGRYDG